MSGVWTRLLSTAAVLACLAGSPASSRADLPPPGLPELIATLMPSVVNITTRRLVQTPTSGLNASASQQTTETRPTDTTGQVEESSHVALGSGFVIDPDGLIVTNNHVIDGAYDVTATFLDGTTVHADVVATTKIGDIALLKVNMGRKLPFLKFGDSTTLRVGDPVVAIGNPLGFGDSVSTGIVSALNRDIMISPFDDFIQTDAALNHGNSGGPLFNLKGEVIGVNTALFSPTDTGGSIGLGFAIPAYCVQFVVSQLRTYGTVRAGDIGVQLQDATAEIAQAVALPPTSRTASILPGSAGWGVIVTEAAPDGPAAQVGIREGDLLLKIDDQPIADMRAFARAVAVKPLGQKVTITLWRNGAELTVNPVVREWLSNEQIDRAALARSQPRRNTDMDMGLRLTALTGEARQAHNLPPNQPGVLITGVMAASIAGDRGLGAGDVILKVADSPVQTPQDVMERLRGLWNDHRTMALLLVRGQTGLRWVPLPMQYDGNSH